MIELFALLDNTIFVALIGETGFNARTFLLLLVIAATPITHDIASAENLEAPQKALELITNTADRICNIVSIKGDADSSETNADVKAQLDGLLSKLADIGTSGSGGINNETYQKVLQQDLSATLKDNAACKLKVFDSLLGKLLEPATAPSVPVLQPPPALAPWQAPALQLFPAPAPQTAQALLRTLTAHTNTVWFVAFSPDGRTLASGSIDNNIKLWDVASGRLLRTLTGHTNHVYSVAFSPDGRSLASGSWDKTIRLWDSASGQLLRTLTGHSGAVESVAFSPDGRTLASGGTDKNVKLWDLSNVNEAGK